MRGHRHLTRQLSATGDTTSSCATLGGSDAVRNMTAAAEEADEACDRRERHLPREPSCCPGESRSSLGSDRLPNSRGEVVPEKRRRFRNIAARRLDQLQSRAQFR